MTWTEIETLPRAQRLSLAYLGRAESTKLGPAFMLDFRLSQIVRTASEPILAQMRIAWWRDMLKSPLADRPKGDPVLSSIAEPWNGHEPILLKLADAWEELLLTESLTAEVARRVAEGRGAFLSDVMRAPGAFQDQDSASIIATHWALADLAAHFSKKEERDLIFEIAGDYSPKNIRLPRYLRGIAVLNALARHSLTSGGRPLAEGRMGALIALRAGLLGR